MSRVLRLRLVLLSLSLSLCLGAPAVADVYKYVDEKGQVLYTDRPQNLPAERVNIHSQRTDSTDLESRTEAENKAAAERDKVRKDAQKSHDDQKQASEITATGKAEACNKARKDYLGRMNAQRLYEELPSGERRYLDSKEIDATRAAAKQAVDTLCN